MLNVAKNMNVLIMLRKLQRSPPVRRRKHVEPNQSITVHSGQLASCPKSLNQAASIVWSNEERKRSQHTFRFCPAAPHRRKMTHVRLSLEPQLARKEAFFIHGSIDRNVTSSSPKTRFASLPPRIK